MKVGRAIIGLTKLNGLSLYNCGSTPYHPFTTNTSTSATGQHFALALLAKDWERREFLLDESVDFRGLTPGRPWEALSTKESIYELFT